VPLDGAVTTHNTDRNGWGQKEAGTEMGRMDQKVYRRGVGWDYQPTSCRHLTSVSPFGAAFVTADVTTNISIH